MSHVCTCPCRKVLTDQMKHTVTINTPVHTSGDLAPGPASFTTRTISAYIEIDSIRVQSSQGGMTDDHVSVMYTTDEVRRGETAVIALLDRTIEIDRVTIYYCPNCSTDQTQIVHHYELEF